MARSGTRATGRARPPKAARTAPPPAQPRAEQAPRRTWLDGPPPRTDGHAGDRLGLPAQGRGSVAGQGAKLGALLLDLLVAGLITLAVIRPHTADQHYVSNLISDGVFVLLTAGGLALSGRTLGMWALRLQVVRLDGRRMGWRSLPRQVLCGLLVPALLVNRDRRGLHDQLLGTVVVHVR